MEQLCFIKSVTCQYLVYTETTPMSKQCIALQPAFVTHTVAIYEGVFSLIEIKFETKNTSP